MNRCRRLLVVFGLLTEVAVLHGANRSACETLGSLKLPHTAITLAQTEAAGTFRSPEAQEATRNAALYSKLPTFCRVVADSTPTADSHIQIEVWMPAASWNGKFQGQGNGGFAGSISYSLMAAALASGYATAGTDTGHKAEGTDADWALGHPEKIADFGYRGVHEMTETAKAIIDTFYGSGPRKSYFVACSDGGREALMEAQRFPDDYDGILAGAPANNWSRMLVSGADLSRLANKPENAIPDTKLPAIHAAVLAACDASDGVKDGVLADPRKCHFDPAAILCKGEDSIACLTAPQVALLHRLYAGGTTSKGDLIFPGYLPGGELGDGGWRTWILGSTPGHSTGTAFVNGYFRNMVFDNPTWTPESTTPDDTLKVAMQKTSRFVDSVDPDLSAFEKRGGKLVIYHGWNDPAISAVNSINYYESVSGKMGSANVAKFLRLYMVPGMQHCIGGPGPSIFGQFSSLPQNDSSQSIYKALESWVEKGTAPQTIVAAKVVEGSSPPAIQTTRPICPYPQLPAYKGAGDPNTAANFTCTADNR